MLVTSIFPILGIVAVLLCMRYFKKNAESETALPLQR
jgi:uncharacterized membrane protein YuzA (DUF378 family)